MESLYISVKLGVQFTAPIPSKHFNNYTYVFNDCFDLYLFIYILLSLMQLLTLVLFFAFYFYKSGIILNINFWPEVHVFP